MSKELTEWLKRLKFVKRQSYEDVIRRMIEVCVVKFGDGKEVDLDELRELLWFGKKFE